MSQFANVSDFNNRWVRYGLIILYVPLLTVSLAVSVVGGLLLHSTNYVVQILNSTTNLGHNVMGHAVSSVRTVLNDLNAAARGRR